MRVQSNYIKTLTATNSIKNAVNRQATQVKSLVARPVCVTHIQFDSQKVINENQIDCLDDGTLRNIITAYWTSRYGGMAPTAATVNAYIRKFKEYTETATRMVGRFLCMKKCQDQWNLDNDDFGQIGRLFTAPQDANIGELESIITNNNSAAISLETQINAPLANVFTVFGDFTQPANAISSASWTRRFTTPLKNVFLPIDVINMMNLILGSTIELTSDDDETVRYVQFWQPASSGGNFPDAHDGSVANFLTAYDADYNQIQTIYSEYPMIKDILTAMNYVGVLDYVNTRRDLAGKTLRVIRDRNDVLEYAIKSVLLSQQDIQNNADLLNNSVVVEAKRAYLPEVIFTTPFNSVITDLYNVENFLRGKVVVLCVSLLTIVKAGGGTNVTRSIEAHCGDNIAVYSDSRPNADYTRLIASSQDAITEADALQSCILHSLTIASDNHITVTASYVECSSKVYTIPEGDVGNLLFCVNSGFYIDQPTALAKLSGDTLYSVDAGVATVVTFGEDSNKSKSSKSSQGEQYPKKRRGNKGSKPRRDDKKDKKEEKVPGAENPVPDPEK